MPTVRDLLVRLHRWVGLAIAGFLVVAGLTGSVIVFNHELDEWLNPELYHIASAGSPQSPLDLAARLDAAEPRRHVRYVPLTTEPGRSLVVGLASDTDPATGVPYDDAYYEVFVDPVTGARLGEREWGACCLSRQQALPFLYSIHYSLRLPEVWGMRVMGAIAIAWLLDSFVGVYLTLPRRRTETPAPAGRRPAAPRGAFWKEWRPSWQIKLGANPYRINFDLHRAMGLWLYPVLIALSVSGVYLALRAEVFRPALELIAEVSPDPYLEAASASHPVADAEGVTLHEIAQLAESEASRRGWRAPFDAFYVQQAGLYGVGFGDHHRPGLGVPYLYFSAADGRILGAGVPGEGTRADVVMQAMFPLHNGNIAGLPGRILIAVSGVLVAALSITGVVIWQKKRRGQLALARRRRQAALAQLRPTAPVDAASMPPVQARTSNHAAH